MTWNPFYSSGHQSLTQKVVSGNDPIRQGIFVTDMFSRVFLCLLLFAATAYSQPVYPPPPRIDPPDVVIAVSADGHTLAIARSSGGSAKRYGRIELWNTRTGELQRTITGFDGPIWSMAFSKDGKTVLTVSTEYRNEKIQNSIRKRDDTVTAELKSWDTESGEFVTRCRSVKKASRVSRQVGRRPVTSSRLLSVIRDVNWRPWKLQEVLVRRELFRGGCTLRIFI